MLWPEHNLLRDELCRRLLLDGCDSLMIAEHFGFDEEHPRLLEPACSPPPRMPSQRAAGRA